MPGCLSAGDGTRLGSSVLDEVGLGDYCKQKMLGTVMLRDLLRTQTKVSVQIERQVGASERFDAVDI